MKNGYDIIVIGAGSAGLSAAAGGAALGAKVALLEHGEMGGDCLNTGCVPSKTFLRTAHLAGEIRNCAAYGLRASLDETDLSKVMARVRSVIGKIAPHDSQERFEGLGVDVFRARGSFLDPHTVQAGGRILKGSSVIIAAGSLPAVPALPGLGGVPYHTNLDIFGLEKLPKHLLLLGGGPVGLELGQGFRQLGSRVTIVERGERLFPKDDPEVGPLMERLLRAEGIDLRLSAAALSVKRLNGNILLETKDKYGARTLNGDCLLIAAGRRPSTAGLGLEKAGVKTDGLGYVTVDARLRTNVRNIYACGDITGPYLFTHMAGYQAGIAIRNIVLKLPARADYSNVPWTTYTSPEVAHTGYTEPRARELGLFKEAVLVPLREIDRALADSDEEGFLKVVLGRGSRIIGATLVARKAGEIIPLASLAIRRRLKARDLAGVIFPYPVEAEIFKSASVSVLKRSLKGWMKVLIRKLFLD